MNTHSARNWLAALTLVASFGLINTAVAQDSATADKKDETVTLEKFSVTGSRIKRLDAESPQPVVTITRGDIDSSGFNNLQDLLKSLPSNTGASNQVFQTASFTRGASTLNPRGLGGNRFLVLINGRRAATYALTTSGNTSIFDFNSVPLSAVEKIEFLKDGASAIYGSDAITGVYNLILRKDYQGFSTNMTVGNTTGHDALYTQLDVLAGASSRNTSITAGASYNHQNSTFIKDYNRSKTTDYSYLSDGSATGNFRFINQNSTLSFPFNLTLPRTLLVARGVDLGTSTSSSVNVVGNPAGQGTPVLSGFAAAPGTGGGTIANANRYDFAKTFQILPDSEAKSAFFRLNHTFDNGITAFLDVRYSNNFYNYYFTPTPISGTGTPLPSPLTINGGTNQFGETVATATFSTLVIPWNNPYNPFGVNIASFLGRTSFGPPRIFDTEATAANFLAGFNGTFADKWNWDSGFSYGSSTITSVSRNAMRVPDLENALAGTTRATAFNPFGPSDTPSLITNLFTISNSSAKAEGWMGDLHVENSEVVKLPDLNFVTGFIGLAAGYEWRQDKLDTRPDTQSYVGSGGGLPLTGTRTVQSEYVELNIPLLRMGKMSAEAQVAVRHESYSDFGKTTKPKYGAKLKLPENAFVNVLLRGSYSESFAAPNLGQLYSTQTTGFTSSLLSDPLRPTDPPQQIRQITGGNPLLKPEEGKVTFIGGVFEIPVIKQKKWGELGFDIDYFKIDITNVITTPSASTILARTDIFPDTQYVVRDNTFGYPGPISYVKATPVNLAYWKYQGVDFGVNYRMNNTASGDYSARFAATRLYRVVFNSGLGNADFNNVGFYGNPRWTATADLGWKYKDYGASVRVNYQGAWTNDGYSSVSTFPMKATYVVNPQFTYRGLPGFMKGTRVTVGVNNVFGAEPDLVGRETPGFDANLTSNDLQLGRFYYLRLSREF
jgi:iron complex outermembrane receptor protein